MLRSSGPLFKEVRAAKWRPQLNEPIRRIFDRNLDGSELSESESRTILNYYSKQAKEDKGWLEERSFLVKFLYNHKDYRCLINLGNSLLYKADNNMKDKVFRNDVSEKELERYLCSLIFEGQTIKLDIQMMKLISELSLLHYNKIIRLLNSVIIHMIGNPRYVTKDISQKWVKWLTAIHGHCEFTNFAGQKSVMSPLLQYLQEEKTKKAVQLNLLSDLDYIRTVEGDKVVSQFSSTIICLYSFAKNHKMVEKVWNCKKKLGLNISSSDLLNIMKAYCQLESYNKVFEVYEHHPNAHENFSQFDYILIALSKTEDWATLQHEFDNLFKIGKLPTIRHYGIVMNSMARIGEVKSVEKLFTQILARGMKPTFVVLQSLLSVQYKTGNMRECFASFENFAKYDVKPSSATYTIIFKVYRNMKDIEGALRFLRKLTNVAKPFVTEAHFSILLNLCSDLTNYPVAEELFEVMKTHYDITPTGKSVASLMKVYIESLQPQRALSISKKYIDKLDQQSGVISLHNKSIKANIILRNKEACRKHLEEILGKNLQVDEEFYSVMLEFVIDLKNDLKTADEIVDQLLNHPTVEINAVHFQLLMDAYEKRNLYHKVFELYEKMKIKDIAINGKILLTIIKSSFKSQLVKNKTIDASIDMIEKVIQSAADETLNATFNQPHPAIIAWPMRIIAKHSSPSRALDLLNRYNNLFIKNSGLSANSNLTVMKSLLVISSEVGQWDDFNNLFEQYMARIEKYNSLPSVSVINKKLSSLMLGVFPLKVEQLLNTNSIVELPALIERIRKNRLTLDNGSWNLAVKVLFEDFRTIDYGIETADRLLIHGYNLIQKARHLKNLSKKSAVMDSWFLQKKRQDKKNFSPSLYLKINLFDEIVGKLDNYLIWCNERNDLVNEVKRLCKNHKYFMKSYLMKPRTDVDNWDKVEKELSNYLLDIRTNKRAKYLEDQF